MEKLPEDQEESVNELIQEDNELIESVSSSNLREPDKKQVIRLIKQEVFTGPLPPPQYLKMYNEIIPGSGERILSMAEKEMSHRHDVDDKCINSEFKLRSHAQYFTFFICLIIAVLGAYLCITGHNAQGFISIAIAAFPVIKASFTKDSEDNDKEK